MITRLYIDNFRCFRNFEIRFDETSRSAMIIGPNGVGKSSIGEVLSIFRQIGLGETRLQRLIGASSLSGVSGSSEGQSQDRNSKMRFEIELEGGERKWKYALAVENFKVVEEFLSADGQRVFDRGDGYAPEAVVLPIRADGIEFRRLLATIFVIKPVPQSMSSSVDLNDSVLNRDCSNFASWCLTMLAKNPQSYEVLANYLSNVFKDFGSVTKEQNATLGDILSVGFKTRAADEIMGVPFAVLSDGEKCQFLAAAILACNSAEDGLVCFWDEPDNYITTAEISMLMPALCHGFMNRGQLIVTSHSREAINTFGENEIIALIRSAHDEPVRPPIAVSELREKGVIRDSLDRALESGEVFAI